MTGTKTDKRIIAWRLLAPSTSGGKVYTIAVFDTELFVCWGRAVVAGDYDPGVQSKREYFASHASALAAAMDRTTAKQERGYEMDIPPKQLPEEGSGLYTAIVRRVLRDGKIV